MGKHLEEIYWRPGNGAAFLELVQQLTAEPLSADAWVSRLKQSVDSVVQQEEQDYLQAVQTGPKIKPGQQASSWSCICAASNSSLQTAFVTRRTLVLDLFCQSVSCVDILAVPNLRPCCFSLSTIYTTCYSAVLGTIVVGVLKGVLCRAQSEHGMLRSIARRALDGFNVICRRAS